MFDKVISAYCEYSETHFELAVAKQNCRVRLEQREYTTCKMGEYVIIRQLNRQNAPMCYTPVSKSVANRLLALKDDEKKVLEKFTQTIYGG